MKPILLACYVVAIGACTADEPPQYLPSDVTFVRSDVPECVKLHPDQSEGTGYPCCQALAFYHDGEMAKISGLEGFPGHYELFGSVAKGTVFGQDFEFDLATTTVTGSPFVAGPWLADTKNVYSIACLQ